MLARLALATFVLLAASVAACGDSAGPAPDNGSGTGTTDSAVHDSGPVRDVAPIGDNNVLPWPDVPPKPDLTGKACTPGATGMCEGNKNYRCSGGKCAKCPANYVDCDRQGDCECFGACNGSKCVKGGG